MPHPRNKPYHHGNLAPALVEAAARLVETEGPAAVTMRAVAERAGVSASALYRHFADKEALLVAVAARGFAALVERFEQAGAGLPPRDALTALGLAYLAFAQDFPHLHGLMFGPRVTGAEAHADLAHWSERSFRLLAEATAACLGPQADAHRVTTAAMALWALVHGLASLRRDGHLSGLAGTAPPDLARIITSLALSG